MCDLEQQQPMPAPTAPVQQKEHPSYGPSQLCSSWMDKELPRPLPSAPPLPPRNGHIPVYHQYYHNYHHHQQQQQMWQQQQQLQQFQLQQQQQQVLQLQQQQQQQASVNLVRPVVSSAVRNQMRTVFGAPELLRTTTSTTSSTTTTNTTRRCCWCVDDIACADCSRDRRTQNVNVNGGNSNNNNNLTKIQGDNKIKNNSRHHAVVLKGCDVKNVVSCRTINYQYILSLRKAKLPHNTWLRLGSLLLVLLLAIASVQSAPTMTLESRRLSSAPKWMNPCGFAAEEFEGDIEVAQLNDATLLGNIVMQAKTALNYAQSFRDDYIKRTFTTDFTDLHLAWKTSHYDWLPGPKQIPKQLGEQLEQEFLDKMEVRMLDTALLDAYEYMQRYAVGLEQIAWDQEDYNLEFRKQFKDTEYHLRSVLCELQMALAERQVDPRADVSRDIMSSEYRSLSDATFRNLRDWMIYRDYMNGLEYIIQVFEHLVSSMES